MIWKILEIEKTKDENVIRDAYHKKLRSVNPEDDAEGFKELRRAYEEAMNYASEIEDESAQAEDESEYGYGKKTEVDAWLERVDVIYRDAIRRQDESLWKQILQDPVCDDLDMELEAAEKLLVYFMSHSYMPQAIWKLVDQRFHYQDNVDQLKEKFPENYVDYVMWQIKQPNFIDFRLFDGKTDAGVDEYIAKLYEEKNAFEEGNLEAVERFLRELKRFDIAHPFTQVEEARYLLEKARIAEGDPETPEKEAAQEYRKQALDIMEELDFEYSDNLYIERVYAQTLIASGQYEKAMDVYENLLEKDEKNFSAAVGKARCVFLLGDPEEAKEMVEEILEDRVQDVECMQLLDEINAVLEQQYQGKLDTRDDYFKLGWCYYQQKEFEKGIALLDEIEEGEDYDYVNLRCRLYLANEDYEKAYPLTKTWLKLIEAAEDDGSKEAKKKKNRLSLAYFSIGVCEWEIGFKNGKTSKHAAESIQRAIATEQNILVRLSYMEQLARFYLLQKEYEKTIECCDQIIEQDSGFFPAYVHRQKANYELKNAKEVIDDFFVCKDLYPGYSVPYVLAAEVFMAFEQYDDVENVIHDGEEAGLESDGLELYRIKCIHYKDFSPENVRKAIDQLDQLMHKIESRENDEDCDIQDLSELHREMAVLYWDLDMNDKAMEIVDAYLKEHPDADEILQLKADILLREKEYEQATKLYQRLVAKEPQNRNYQMKLGNCYEYLEKTEKAMTCYKKILKQKEDYVPAVRRLMYIYSYLSNEKKDLSLCKIGISYATRLIELTGSAEGYVERGNLNIDLYELEQAVADCKEAIRLDPEAYYAYNNLGCALLKLRRVKEAVEPLCKVIAMEPDRDHLPYLNLAECYVILKEYDKAIHAYEEVLRLRPQSLYIQKKIAEIWVAQKEYKKAEEFYLNRIRKAKKESRTSLFEHGLMSSERAEKKKEDQDLLVTLYGDLADFYEESGDVEKAQKYYEKVENLFFKNNYLYKTNRIEDIVQFYRDCGNLTEAERLINRLADFIKKKNGSITHALFTMATVYFEMKQKDKAKECADRFLQYYLSENEGEEKMLADLRYYSIYAYDLAVMHICAGRIDEAKKYLEQMKDKCVCVTCETCDCFEYYFAMGLIAESEGETETAKRYYEHACDTKGYYGCASHHLKQLQNV